MCVSEEGGDLKVRKVEMNVTETFDDNYGHIIFPFFFYGETVVK